MSLIRWAIALTQLSCGHPVHRGVKYVSLALLAGFLYLGHAHAAAITVSLSMTPAQTQIRPDLDVAQVTLQVLHEGQPLTAGHLRVKLTSPKRTSWLSTDFPIVEGTALLDLASDLKNGDMTFSYMFPIRGTYILDMTVSPSPAGPVFLPTTLQQTLDLSENPTEVRNTWFLVAGLLLLGGISGVIFSRSASAQEALPRLGLIALVSTGFVVSLLPVGHAVATQVDTQQHVIQGKDGWSLEVRATPTATVGQLASFDVVLKQNGVVFADATQTSIVLHHVEDDRTTFQATTYSQTGQSAQSIQFFDGAPHTVTITAQPSGPSRMLPVTAAFDMDVIGLQPPMTVKIRTLSLLIGVLIVGMTIGFFLLGGRKERGIAAV